MTKRFLLPVRQTFADLPPELAAVALVDAVTCAAVGGMRTSWWFARVAAGEAPQPVIRAPRCTRWLAKDVAAFWAAKAAAKVDDAAAAAVSDLAHKASGAESAQRGVAA